MPTFAQILQHYLGVTISYWWVIVPSILMPLRDVLKIWRNWRTPHWLELLVLFVCLSIAQFLAYRNSVNNLYAVIEEKRQFSMAINSLNDEKYAKDQKIQSLQAQIEYIKKHSPIPADVQLQNDAYRLAEDIDYWYTNVNWDAVTAEHSSTQNVFNTPDFIRFSKPPNGFNPSNPNRAYDWMQYVLEGFKPFQQRSLVLIEHFKERGVNLPPTADLKLLENVTGPIGFRNTITSLREMAKTLGTKTQR